MNIKDGIRVMARSGLVSALALMSCNVARAGDAAEDSSRDPWRINVSVRGWYNNWTSWGEESESSTSVVSFDNFKAKLALIPQVGVQFRDFQLSASYFPSTSYKFIEDQKSTRREYDINFGYTVIPGLVASAGYKSIVQNFDGFKIRTSGPALALSGSAPLVDELAIYWNFAYGRLNARFDDGGRVDARYVLVEPGLGYMIPTSGRLGLDAIILTLGYRLQLLRLNDEVESGSPSDITRGISFGVVASF